MNHLRIGVLMGGKSLEREVSLNSGRTVCDHLDTSRYQPIPIYQTASGKLYLLPWVFLHRGKTADFEHRLEGEAQVITWDALKELVDFIYIAFHGRYGEDGTVQGFLEVLRIPYFGSKVFASALGMHKAMQKDFLRAHGIVVPNGIVVSAGEIERASPRSFDTFYYASTLRKTLRLSGSTQEEPDENSDLKNLHVPAQPECFANVLMQQNVSRTAPSSSLTFPLIIKPVQEGSSFGITKVEREEDLLPALQKASQVSGRRQDVLIEEYIEGMEFSCIVITDYKTGQLIALPPTEIEIEKDSAIFDYEQKYMPGRATKHTPARCSAESIKNIQESCKKVFSVLGFENLGRIDGFVTKDGRVIITDPNSFSGMSPSSYAFLQAAQVGINHTALINHLIETELHAYGMLDNIEREEKKEVMTEQPKMRIAVMLGGVSNEKEISLESGRNVSYKLSPQKYAVKTLFLNKDLQLYDIPSYLLVRNSTQEIEEGLTPAMKVLWNDLPKLFDFVFIALHGGVGENGSVQGTLEMLGLPYNGSGVLASGLCMDKYKTNEFLLNKGFEIPKHWLVSKEDWECFAAPYFPLIVKPHDDGCSVMVHKVQNEQELHQALATIFAQNKTHALIEEFIQGMELTVGVIGNDSPRALPPSQAVAAGGILSIEEKFLPGAGENQTPAPLPQAALQFVQKTMENVFSAVGCKGYVRIDCFYQTAEQSPTGAERVVVLEINTLPGMTPATCLFHQAAEIGIKPMDFVDLIVQLGCELHTQQAYLNVEQRNMLKQVVR